MYLPIDATIGPQARAKAPNDRNIPVITPFWFSGPILVTRVIMHVTTIAVAVTNQIISFLLFIKNDDCIIK